MAGGDGLPPDRKVKKQSKSNSTNESERKSQVVELDLVIDKLRKHDNYRLGNQNTGAGNFVIQFVKNMILLDLSF